MSDKPTWLDEAPLQQLFAATRAAGGEARAVGGAVRDWLMSSYAKASHDGGDLWLEALAPGDVDVASTLAPERTMEIAAQQGWKAIPTGIDHGTVTLVLPGRVVEVTTLRRDVTTDGRHAMVAFTDNWQEDAARRDFTMNAISMDASGKVFDFFEGKKDIADRRLAFIGDAATRIAEDGLRMLRYFRFLATHGKPPADGDALAAIAAKKEMITKLSGERIANEMRKLLAAENPSYALRLMLEQGIAPLVFGRAIDASRMIRLHMLENQADYQCSVWARVVALLGASGIQTPSPEKPEEGFSTSPQGRGAPASALSPNHQQASRLKERHKGDAGAPLPRGEVDAPAAAAMMGKKSGASGEGALPNPPHDDTHWLSNRWKLARHETKQLTQLLQLPAFAANAPRHAHTRIIRLHSAPVYLDWLLTQAAVQQGIDIAPYVALAHEFKPPRFPITAKDLIAQGMKEGKALGDALAVLERKWEESDYRLGREELLRDF